MSFCKPAWNPPVSTWQTHGPFAFWLIEACQPRQLVELGAHWGFSYMVMCQAVAQLGLPTRCYSIDTWQGDEHAGFYGEEVFEALSEYNQEQYEGFSQLVRCTFDEAVPAFEDGSIDLLHIDGRHFYEDVKHDFESWLPKMSNRGIMLFHDITVRKRDFGVWQLWSEIKEKYGRHFHFDHGHGLGILSVGDEVPEKLQPLFTLEKESAEMIRFMYCRLGEEKQVLLNLERALGNAEQRIAELEDIYALQQERLIQLKTVKESALRWQRQSWWRRAFYRPPEV